MPADLVSVARRALAPKPRPLRIAALVKQVPMAESMVLGPDGRMIRGGIELEMNPYCRRAVAKGHELAKSSGGTCTVFTLGPASAEDCLREAIAWGAHNGVHLSDAVFAGSDTLATARALAAALESDGPFDLILVGRNSVDSDTGQVGPEIAELLDLPFATGVREMTLVGHHLHLTLELDDGWEEVEVALPAVLSVAERLCDPCKVAPEGRAQVAPERIRRLHAHDLGPGPWGEAGSPTRVGDVRAFRHDRRAMVLEGAVEEQVARAVRLLSERGALADGPTAGAPHPIDRPPDESPTPGAHVVASEGTDTEGYLVAVLIEPDRDKVSAELLGAARGLAQATGGTVIALAVGAVEADWLGSMGADEVVVMEGSRVEEDVASTLVEWARAAAPWAVLVPSTSFGREVAGRCAASIGAGLIGDAIGVGLQDGRLVAAKPVFSGALVADITCTSPVQMVTLRPGVLPMPDARHYEPTVTRRTIKARARVVVTSRRRDDDVEVLARADVVIGLGAGVLPEDYPTFSRLSAILGAELAATRKVTDKGWAPRARQVGITGRSIAPRLYVAVGLSGKFNHMVGVRSAGTVLAINNDPDALVFSHCDIGIVGDWREVLPRLEDALRPLMERA